MPRILQLVQKVTQYGPGIFNSSGTELISSNVRSRFQTKRTKRTGRGFPYFILNVRDCLGAKE